MARHSDGTLTKLMGKSDLVTGANSLATLYYQGVIKLYDGAQPADANDAITTQALVGTITLGEGAFTEGVGTNGLVFGTPTVTGTGAAKVVSLPRPAGTLWGAICPTLSGTKTATWGRLQGNAVDSGGLSTSLCRTQVTVSDSTGSGELKLNTVTCVTGTELIVATFEIKLGA